MARLRRRNRRHLRARPTPRPELRAGCCRPGDGSGRRHYIRPVGLPPTPARFLSRMIDASRAQCRHSLTEALFHLTFNKERCFEPTHEGYRSWTSILAGTSSSPTSTRHTTTSGRFIRAGQLRGPGCYRGAQPSLGRRLLLRSRRRRRRRHQLQGLWSPRQHLRPARDPDEGWSQRLFHGVVGVGVLRTTRQPNRLRPKVSDYEKG